jgi:endonuclease/exonuclease/phosphatase family metal-dependent hydrolase
MWCCEHFWKFRPSALAAAQHNYRDAYVHHLHACYARDNKSCSRIVAEKEGGKQQGRTEKRQRSFRTCQWNINSLNYFLAHDNFFESDHDAANKIADTLLETDSDVMVLNEFGEDWEDPGRPIRHLQNLLENNGYRVYISRCLWPTAIATRLPLAATNTADNTSRPNEQYLNLDEERGAVRLDLIAEDGRILRAYGTHLAEMDVLNGKYRKREMKALLQHIAAATQDDEQRTPAATMIIGDFNQQRQQDYASDEWTAICANKERRGSPENDGNAEQLQNAGFICTLDAADASTTRNWDASKHPPPATHWSGTIVDYTYFRSPLSLQVSGIFVSPCGFSDHRLIVTDWRWQDDHNTCKGEVKQ